MFLKEKENYYRKILIIMASCGGISLLSTEASIIIKADLNKVFNLARNIEQFPQFMPNIEKVTVLERYDNRTISEWVTNIEGTPILWKQEEIFDEKAKIIYYRLLEGDLDCFEGEWLFTKCGNNATKVTLSVNFDFGVPFLTQLMGTTLQMKVKENSQIMLDAMKQKLESATA